MSKSGNQELMDASDHVQINLYYEEATLELFVDLAKNYKLQSKKYDMLLRIFHQWFASHVSLWVTYNFRRSYLVIDTFIHF